MEKVGGASVSALPFLLIGGLFVLVGVGMWISVPWNLVTGGPRDRTKPGQPYVYDRLYYLLLLVGLVGWSVALLSFLATLASGRIDSLGSLSGFMVGWGIMAIAMGTLYALRLDMMEKASEYLSKNGFILFRLFHIMRLRQFQRQRAVWKIISPIFIVAGIGVSAFYLPHIGDVPRQVTTGAQILVGQIQKIATGQLLAGR